MTRFDDPLDLPTLTLQTLKDDDEGTDLLERLDTLETRAKEAEEEARTAGRDLPDLMADADELAAQAMVGDADPEEADAAEAKVQEARERVNEARRRARQSTRAIRLLEEKIRDRAAALHEENAERVRATHRAMVRRALQAEREAAMRLRVLREFEARYARYTTERSPSAHPEYLTAHERTNPPRALMAAARTPGGNVFQNAPAHTWMQTAADYLDVEPPHILELNSLDFEDAEVLPQTYRPEDEAEDEAEDAPEDASEDAYADDGPVEKADEPAKADEEETGEDASDSEVSGDSPSDGDASGDAPGDAPAEDHASEADAEDARTATSD